MATNFIDSKKLGATLKRLIKASSYKTQERFAEECVYVTPRAVRNWVTGKLDSMSTLNFIAEKLGVDVMTILGESLG